MILKACRNRTERAGEHARAAAYTDLVVPLDETVFSFLHRIDGAGWDARRVLAMAAVKRQNADLLHIRQGGVPLVMVSHAAGNRAAPAADTVFEIEQYALYIFSVNLLNPRYHLRTSPHYLLIETAIGSFINSPEPLLTRNENSFLASGQ